MVNGKFHLGGVTVRAGTLEETFVGPDHPTAGSSDSTEPYGWNDPANPVTQALIDEYKALSQADKDATVLILDDGEDVESYARGSLETGVPVLSGRVVTDPPTPSLTLDDWSEPADTEAICLALLEATGTTTLYADSDRGGSGTPIDGELGLGDGETVISRIWRSGAILRFNDNDNPAALDLDDYFQTGGGGENATIYVQTADGVENFVVSGNIHSTGGNWINFNIPTAFQTLLGDIATGDRFILAIINPVEEESRHVRGSLETGVPVLSGRIVTDPPVERHIRGSIETGTPVLSGVWYLQQNLQLKTTLGDP